MKELILSKFDFQWLVCVAVCEIVCVAGFKTKEDARVLSVGREAGANLDN